ncbi:MAG TPA: DHH family phosphoesterase [Bacillales bacterium]|nr:DHH family phosphoesterase [Bacillales bacterium]
MPDQLKSRQYDYVVGAVFLTTFICLVILLFFKWIIGVVGLVVLAALFLFGIRERMRHRKELEMYVSTLSHRVKKVGDEALTEMPIGILLYNEHYQIEWMNPYIGALLGNETFFGNSLNHISQELIPCLKTQAEQEIITINKRKFRVYFKRDDRLLYFFDVTELVRLKRLSHEEETVLGIIYLDNYEELTQGMDDQVRSHFNSEVTSILKSWATDNGIFLKRIDSERFFAVLNQRTLEILEKNKFSVLDKVRESTAKENVPLTLSIGIGSGLATLPELGELAQSGLDLALGRGGDQVAIKQTDGKVSFHGGKTNPIEKRTRVRARVISHALRELVLASDQVIIMGHKSPDMDAIGASIGILKIAEANEKDGFIVLDRPIKGTGIGKLIQEVKKDEALWPRFISNDEAMERATGDSLLVVVDTHRPSMVIEHRLFNKTEHVVVIDHHRRGEEFIDEPVLVYMEPYASSTSELVTELLEYQPSRLKMNVLEATSLLAGITVDTKSFTLRTGSRTFDAASYLRSRGADTILVQKLLRDDLQKYIQRARLLEDSELYRGGFAIAKANDGDRFDQVLIAQAADTLLSMRGVNASFVLCRRDDGKIGISARSLGDMNVQMIMEALGGGGHLTNAAAQLEGEDLDEAVKQLKAIIDQTLEGGEEQ